MTNVLYNLQCFLNQRCTWCRIKTTWLMWLKFVEAWVNRLKPTTSSVNEVRDSFLFANMTHVLCIKTGAEIRFCFVYRLFGTLSENEYRNTPQKKVSNSNRDPSNFSELLGPTKEPSNRIPKSCPTLWLQRSFVKIVVFARLSLWFAAKERNIVWMKNWLPNKSHSLPIHARDYSKHYDPPRLTNKLDHLGWNFGSSTEKFLFPWGRSLPWNKALIFQGPFAFSCRVILWIVESFQWLYLFLFSLISVRWFWDVWGWFELEVLVIGWKISVYTHMIHMKNVKTHLSKSSFAQFFRLHPSFAPLLISMEQKCSNKLFSETSHSMKKPVSCSYDYDKFWNQRTKGQSEHQSLGMQSQCQPKAPMANHRGWVLRPFSLKFRKGPRFLRWKNKFMGRFLFTPKEKKATLLIAFVFWIVLGDQVVVVTLAEQLIADIQTNYTMQHSFWVYLCIFSTSSSCTQSLPFLAVNFYGFEVLNCAAPSFRTELSWVSSAVSTFTFVHVLLDRPEIHASACRDTQVPKTSKPTKQKTLWIPRF